jgi:hypothetical protein
MGEDIYDICQDVAPEMYLQFDLELSKLGGNLDGPAVSAYPHRATKKGEVAHGSYLVPPEISW